MPKPKRCSILSEFLRKEEAPQEGARSQLSCGLEGGPPVKRLMSKNIVAQPGAWLIKLPRVLCRSRLLCSSFLG